MELIIGFLSGMALLSFFAFILHVVINELYLGIEESQKDEKSQEDKKKDIDQEAEF